VQGLFDEEFATVIEEIMVHHIREKFMRQSSELFQQALNTLPAQFHESRLGGLLKKRLSWNKRRLNAYHASCFFGRLRSALE